MALFKSVGWDEGAWLDKRHNATDVAGTLADPAFDILLVAGAWKVLPALGQSLIPLHAGCATNPICGSLVLGITAKAASGGKQPSGTQTPLGETLYRFSNPDGSFTPGLRKGEEAVSLARTADFSSPTEAFKSLFGHSPGPNDKYLVTNVGTALHSGYLAVYDSVQGGNPYGHVSLYSAEGIKWGEGFMKIFSFFGPAKPVIPGG
jgi:hypothetical protein